MQYQITRQKSLRCFPQCSEHHFEKSFCGSNVTITVDAESPYELNKAFVLAEFVTYSEEPRLTIGQPCPAEPSEVGLMMGKMGLKPKSFVLKPAARRWPCRESLTSGFACAVLRVYLVANGTVCGMVDSSSFVLTPHSATRSGGGARKAREEIAKNRKLLQSLSSTASTGSVAQSQAEFPPCEVGPTVVETSMSCTTSSSVLSFLQSPGDAAVMQSKTSSPTRAAVSLSPMFQQPAIHQVHQQQPQPVSLPGPVPVPVAVPNVLPPSMLYHPSLLTGFLPQFPQLAAQQPQQARCQMLFNLQPHLAQDIARNGTSFLTMANECPAGHAVTPQQVMTSRFSTPYEAMEQATNRKRTRHVL